MSDDNGPKMLPPNKIALLLAILSPEMTNLEMEVQKSHLALQGASMEVQELNRRLDDMYEEERQLRSQVRELEEKNYFLRNVKDDVDYYRTRYQEMEKQMGELHRKVTLLELGVPQDASLGAQLYALCTGPARTDYIGGNKIVAIKKVRDLTNWSLKEAKDFVENLSWQKVTRAEINYASSVAHMGHLFTQEEINAEAEFLNEKADNVGNQKSISCADPSCVCASVDSEESPPSYPPSSYS